MVERLKKQTTGCANIQSFGEVILPTTEPLQVLRQNLDRVSKDTWFCAEVQGGSILCRRQYGHSFL